MIRYLKILLVVFVGLNGFLYFFDNILNWAAASGAVGAVIAMSERAIYPVAIVPAMEGGLLANLALIVILTGEFLVGALSIFGAVKMFAAAGKPANQFNASKTVAIAGCAMALVVWFGGFTVIGGALFQMWQHSLGQGSLGDAHKFLTGSGLVLIWLAMKDE